MDILARAKALEAQGRSIIHMEVGEPDFSTPTQVVEAGKRALDQGLTHYTAAVGIPELRAAIAGFYRRRYNVDLDPARVVVTCGASGALQLVMGTLVNPGDSVLLPDPGYPCNRHFVRLYEGRPVDIPVNAESSYQLTAKLIDRHADETTAGIMVATPSNPTGTTVPQGQWPSLLDAAQRHGARLIVDEIYQGLVYDDSSETVLSLTDQAFVVNSFSKYFGMTGWRLGWLVAPKDFVGEIDKLAQNIFLAPPTVAQYAALAAFEDDTIAELEQRRDEFRARRDFLLPALQELGFDIAVEPAGAFYLYADCSRHHPDSRVLAAELLEQTGVAVTPGLDFGRNSPERYLRFAYTTEQAVLKEGVERIRRYLQSAA